MMQFTLAGSIQLKKLKRVLSPTVLLVAAAVCQLSLTSLAFAASLPDQISFQNILENKDVAMGEGASLLQDSEGYMWLGGSSALIRYDGYEFKQVDVSLSDDPKDKVPSGFVESLFEDSHHRIWVGSRLGLLKYDSHTEKLTKVKDDDSQTVKLSNSQIFRFIELPSGELLGCSATGIYVIDPVTLKYSLMAADPSKPNWLQSQRVSAAYLEGGNTLWFATDLGLEKLDWNTKTFSFFKVNSDNPDAPADGKVTDIVSDGAGKLWLATAHGLVHYDPETRTGKRYLKEPNNRFSLGSNDIWKLLFDSQGVLWVGTDGGGLSAYDKANDRFIVHKFEAGRPGSLSTSVVRTLYEDRSGDIWVGNYPNGINFFDRSSAAIVSYGRDISNPNSLSATRVTSVEEDKDGNLWLGTGGGGLNFFNRKTQEFKSFKADANDPNSISGNILHATYMDKAGILWIGTHEGGMSSYDPSTQKFTRYPYDNARKSTERVSSSNKLNNAVVWDIKEDKNSDLWLTTQAGGISKYNRSTKLYTHYTHVEGDPESIGPGVTWTTLEDSRGNFWVAASSGLYLMDRAKGTFRAFVADPNNPNAISDSNAPSILEDSKKRLWVGTTAGLNLFDPETQKFTAYTKKSGFNNDFIRHIVEGADGLIWVSTDNGFASFDPETHKIKNYNRISGRLIGDFGYRSGMRSRAGEVIFGGTNGLRIINTQSLAENKTIPPVVLTDFKVFADTVAVGGADGLLQNAINHSDKVVLNYTQSMFVLGFSALNYRDTPSNKYRYKLEGFDTDWLDSSAQRSAKYTNLNPGTYVFKVKGSNNDGLWNQEGKSITLVQLPPPWKTWWAYSLYSLLLLGILAWFIRSQHRKRQLIEEQNRILEVKVAERTAEVREKSKDIQIMLSNMRQGLFTIEANGNIHPEYSRFLEDIFETKAIAGQKAVGVLFGSANLGSNSLDQITQVIASVIGEDEMNYTFNAHLLVEEYEANFEGKSKFLSLDWAPVLAGDLVVKLMVSVRDVTLLKKMESEARSKKRELDIISQLLNIPAKKYLAFAASTQRFIDENRATILSNPTRSDTALALLFRNMHTIKGNCRTFAFDHFSNLVHEVESVYSLLRACDDTVWTQESLLNDLEAVEDIRQEYERVYYTVLGRGDTSKGTRDANGCWADSNALEMIQTSVEVAYQQYPALVETKPLLPIQQWLSRATSLPLPEVLADVIGSLSSIAIQLDKEVPQVVIEDREVRIKFSAIELINNIFAHILRNSVDHGIEPAAVRLQAGKRSAGTIVIRAQPQTDRLLIHIRDDGQGIDIDQLFQSGVQLGHWQADEQPSYQDIATLIFVSGISTKEAVTDISGRGVGLDAVKVFVLAAEGNISLQLLGPNATGTELGHGVRVAFEITVELPARSFSV